MDCKHAVFDCKPLHIGIAGRFFGILRRGVPGQREHTPADFLTTLQQAQPPAPAKIGGGVFPLSGYATAENAEEAASYAYV